MTSDVDFLTLRLRVTLLLLITVLGVYCSTDTTTSFHPNGAEIYHGRNVWNFAREGTVNKIRSYNFLNHSSASMNPRVVLPLPSSKVVEHRLAINQTRESEDKQIRTPATNARLQYKIINQEARHEPWSHKFKHNLPYLSPIFHKDKTQLILGSTTYDSPAETPSTELLPPPFKGHVNELHKLSYLPPTKLMPSRCKSGFDTLVADLTLTSIILSFLSLILAIISLIMSNFYNVFGSGFSVIFAGIPSLILNLLNLVDITLPSNSPLYMLVTIISIFDAFNNMFSVVPGSLFSDLIGLISILVGKVSFGLGAMSSYPQLLKRILNFLHLKDVIDSQYGCRTKSLGQFVQDLIGDKFSDDM